MKILLRVLLVIALLATHGAFEEARLGRRERSGELAGRDAPNSFFGLFVFGGFRGLFLEHLWSKADALADEGRYWEVADIFERIARLDPENATNWRVQVYFLVHSVAQEEVDDAMRWRLYHRALRHLDRGIEATDGAYELLELRTLIHFRHIATDPYLSRHARTNIGADGLTLAMESATALRERWPDIGYAHGWYRRVGEEVTERVLNAGRFAAAAPPLEELAAVAAIIRERFPALGVGEREEETLKNWAIIARELGEAFDGGGMGAKVKDEEALERALDRVADLAATPGSLTIEDGIETLDESILNVISFRTMQLCQARCIEGDDVASLRPLPRLRRICDLADGALAPGKLYYSKVYVDFFEAFAGLDAELRQAEEQGATNVAALRERWQKGLNRLEALFKERTGRTDGFRKRMIRARAD